MPAVKPCYLLVGSALLLRRSPIPRLRRAVVSRLDHLMAPRFEAYARETAGRLAHVGAVLDGAMPGVEAEPENPADVGAGFWRAGRLLPPQSLS